VITAVIFHLANGGYGDFYPSSVNEWDDIAEVVLAFAEKRDRELVFTNSAIQLRDVTRIEITR
jgi:hypothetical protein